MEPGQLDTERRCARHRSVRRRSSPPLATRERRATQPQATALGCSDVRRVPASGDRETCGSRRSRVRGSEPRRPSQAATALKKTRRACSVGTAAVLLLFCIGSMQQQHELGRAGGATSTTAAKHRGLAGHLASGNGRTGEARSAPRLGGDCSGCTSNYEAPAARGCRLAQRLQQRTRRTSDHARRVRRRQRSRQGKRLPRTEMLRPDVRRSCSAPAESA